MLVKKGGDIFNCYLLTNFNLPKDHFSHLLHTLLSFTIKNVFVIFFSKALIKRNNCKIVDCFDTFVTNTGCPKHILSFQLHYNEIYWNQKKIFNQYQFKSHKLNYTLVSSSSDDQQSFQPVNLISDYKLAFRIIIRMHRGNWIWSYSSFVLIK